MAESEALEDERTSLAASFIFIIVLIFQFLSTWLNHLNKTTSKSAKEIELRAEIKQLLKDAASFSQPSTFAQAAKLRRLAAAKEKELANYRESQTKGTKLSYDQYQKILFIAKAVTYFLLICWFWRNPVAAVAEQLVQPFGKFLSWGGGRHLNNSTMVGVIPWLILSTRVSKFLCRLF